MRGTIACNDDDPANIEHDCSCFSSMLLSIVDTAAYFLEQLKGVLHVLRLVASVARELDER